MLHCKVFAWNFAKTGSLAKEQTWPARILTRTAALLTYRSASKTGLTPTHV
jgi:hypothetical protein